jgi:hypothetical protein
LSGLESKVETEVGEMAQSLASPSSKLRNVTTNIKNEVEELKKVHLSRFYELYITKRSEIKSIILEVGVEEIEKLGLELGSLNPNLYKNNVNLSAGIPLLQK